jgi:hypothetical protein
MGSYTGEAFVKAARIAEGVRARILHSATELTPEGETTTEELVDQVAKDFDLAEYEKDTDLEV